MSVERILGEKIAAERKVEAVEALAATLAAEAAPYLWDGPRYASASETLRARADCRAADAERIRAALRGDA